MPVQSDLYGTARRILQILAIAPQHSKERDRQYVDEHNQSGRLKCQQQGEGSDHTWGQVWRVCCGREAGGGKECEARSSGWAGSPPIEVSPFGLAGLPVTNAPGPFLCQPRRRPSPIAT